VHVARPNDAVGRPVAILRRLFLTALVEGAVAVVGYPLMGVPAAVLLGMLTGFASVVPVVGTSSTGVPVALVSFVSGRRIPGVLVLAWGAAAWAPALMSGILGCGRLRPEGPLDRSALVSIAPTILELVGHRVFGLEEHRAAAS
jgi:AI-2E family transporter